MYCSLLLDVMATLAFFFRCFFLPGDPVNFLSLVGYVHSTIVSTEGTNGCHPVWTLNISAFLFCLHYNGNGEILHFCFWVSLYFKAFQIHLPCWLYILVKFWQCKNCQFYSSLLLMWKCLDHAASNLFWVNDPQRATAIEARMAI